MNDLDLDLHFHAKTCFTDEEVAAMQKELLEVEAELVTLRAQVARWQDWCDRCRDEPELDPTACAEATESLRQAEGDVAASEHLRNTLLDTLRWQADYKRRKAPIH